VTGLMRVIHAFILPLAEANEVARELEHMGVSGANVLRKMFEEKKDDVASG
jgi:hypothetical protein